MAVSLLLSAHRAGEALALMQDGPQPGTPLSDWQWAEVLGANGQHQQAHALYARVHDALGDSSGDFLNAYARHALTTGRIELAERCAASAVARDARNQEAWSHLGTAWRLLGDAREHWLCDYERLVGCVEVPAPAGFDGQQDFLSALGLVLNGLHTAGHDEDVERRGAHRSLAGCGGFCSPGAARSR